MSDKQLSFIHGFQDGVLGILPQSKDEIYLAAHALGVETFLEVKEESKKYE